MNTSILLLIIVILFHMAKTNEKNRRIPFIGLKFSSMLD